MIDLSKGTFFLVDKPYTWTSFQVVKKLKIAIRNLTGVKSFKIGHAGTLDPLATGLLVVCLGKYTKKINDFQFLDKVYTGSMHLGATTKSFDMEHEEDAHYPTSHITEKLLKQTAESFLGEQEQEPPVYSAVKIAGKRAFAYARSENKVDITKKHVKIYSFDITEIKMPDIKFRISCSKGTYIRSLARDFGQKLNSGAYLTSLRREYIGDYSVLEAKTPDEWCKAISQDTFILPEHLQTQ